MSAIGNASESPYTADTDREALQQVIACGESFENGIGKEFRDTCNRRYTQYRNFDQLRNEWVKAGPNDKDGLLYDAKRGWGSQLHIPLSFRTIETVVPAAIAHRPRMLILPRQMKYADNASSVRVLIDAQQDQIDIDLPFQAVMRSGRIYGLGLGKVHWRTKTAMRRRTEPHPFAGKLVVGKFVPDYRVTNAKPEVIFDDPDFEDVDVFDFMWDEYGHDIDSCNWVIHRTWRGLGYCLAMMRSGKWNTPSVQALLKDGREEEALRNMGNRAKYDEVWQTRMLASGFTGTNFVTRGEQIHEVWEWHDGDRVWTVLDRSLLVQDGENGCLGMKPFMAYRPTPLQKQFIGIGDLEPLEHLQRLTDTMSSQMVDSNTLSLAMGFAYDGATVDEEDLVMAPNAAIEVRNARPSDAIFPLPRPELPQSSFKLLEMARQDIDAVGGVTEALNPAQGGQASTATEAFLVQAALSRRVQLASRRFEIEVVRRAARAFLYLDQRMILANREMLLPAEGMTPEMAAQAGEWRKFEVGPGGLMGDFEIICEGGSMAARNIPQDRADADRFLALAQNPYVDPRAAMQRALQLLGIDDPSSFLKQASPPVPPAALEALQSMGVDPRMIQRALQVAQQQDPQLTPGPTVGQMDQVMAA